MRRRYVYDPDLGEMVEVPLHQNQERVAPDVHVDLPGYESPVTGKWIEGRKARREDLKRSGCRPYEGRETEQQIARSHRESEERRQERHIERSVVDVWRNSPERIRRQFK